MVYVPVPPLKKFPVWVFAIWQCATGADGKAHRRDAARKKRRRGVGFRVGGLPDAPAFPIGKPPDCAGSSLAGIGPRGENWHRPPDGGRTARAAVDDASRLW